MTFASLEFNFWILICLFSATPCRGESKEDIQKIIGYSDNCTAAYSTHIGACHLDSFWGVGGSQYCTTECMIELSNARELTQDACREEPADTRSLLGYTIAGHEMEVLCYGVDENGPALGFATQTTFAETYTKDGCTSPESGTCVSKYDVSAAAAATSSDAEGSDPVHEDIGPSLPSVIETKYLAGIVIGTAAATAFIICLIFYLVLRKRKERDRNVEEPENPSSSCQPAELPAEHEKGEDGLPCELDAQQEASSTPDDSKG